MHIRGDIHMSEELPALSTLPATRFETVSILKQLNGTSRRLAELLICTQN